MTSRSRTPLIIGGVVVIVAVAALVAVLVTRGGGDDGGGPKADCRAGVDTPLPAGEGTGDPCIGSRVPTITGVDYAGQPVTITPGKDGPLMIVVVAHWCPHCNREVPKLIDWQKSGKVPDGLRVVGISTAVRSDAPNYPPDQWLKSLRWSWPVIADDEAQTAAADVGTTGFPFLVFVDAKGNLMLRSAGEMPIEEVQRHADQAAATAT